MVNETFLQLINMHDLDRKVVCKRAIECLSPRLQFIAVRRFYQNQTIDAIAEELGLSQARVYQLERKLVWKMRRSLELGNS
jgi:RNA polymerase sigma factor (sigma-70 family)